MLMHIRPKFAQCLGNRVNALVMMQRADHLVTCTFVGAISLEIN